MMRGKMIFVLMVVVFLLLAGCDSNRIHIRGEIVDQHGHEVEGIKVVCDDSTDVTDEAGQFGLTVRGVETPMDVQVTFKGSHLGFEDSSRYVRVYPEEMKELGEVTLQRVKALVAGTVTNSFLYNQPSPGLQRLEEPKLHTISGLTYPEGEINIKFKDSFSVQSADKMAMEMELQILQQSTQSRIVTVKTEGDTMAAVERLQQRSDVEYAEPNYYVYPLSTEVEPNAFPSCNDPYYDYQWNLQAINMENAWRETRGDSDVIVAVLDTGFQHVSDLEPNMLWELGYDFVDNDSDPSSWFENHGTQVASIIGAVPDNYTGIAGINKYVSIVPIRILSHPSNDGVWGRTSELIAGLEYAIYDADADIINLSIAVDIPWYDLDGSEIVNELLDTAEREGVLVIGAAGNEGENEPTYPARHSNVLAVGAVGPTLQPASYTNTGVDLYAPGGDYYLYPASKKNTIITADSWAQGTSIASAHVAGVAALMLADRPYLSPADLRWRLKSTSLKLAYQESGNPGLVDAYRAITNQEHGRIFVFIGEEDWDGVEYMPEESTYTYNQDGENYFEISSVEPRSGLQWLYAWVDRDADGRLTRGDLLDKERLSLDEGDEEWVHFNLWEY